MEETFGRNSSWAKLNISSILKDFNPNEQHDEMFIKHVSVLYVETLYIITSDHRWFFSGSTVFSTCQNVFYNGVEEWAFSLTEIPVDQNSASRLVIIHNNQSMTKGIGTSVYMSPELIRGETYDSSVDSYAFGILFSLNKNNQTAKKSPQQKHQFS